MLVKREYRDYSNLAKVALPRESFGACANSKNCKNYAIQLGNGYCVKCYDKRLE